MCPVGFDGPRCQQTKHSFSGNGWAWFEPLTKCESSHTSLELMTTKDSGLVLYQGPIAELSEADAEDFMMLEMKNGYPLLRMNLGSGETKLTIDGRDRHGVVRQGKLSDGRWHRVDVFTAGKVCYFSAHFLCSFITQHGSVCPFLGLLLSLLLGEFSSIL